MHPDTRIAYARLMKDRSRYHVVAGILCLLTALVLHLSSCTQTTRTDTLHDVALGITAARDGWLAWSEQRQHELVQAATGRADAQAKVGAFRSKAQLVDDAINVAYQAVVLAWSQNDKISLDTALEHGADLIKTIEKFKADYTKKPGAVVPITSAPSSSSAPADAGVPDGGH